MSDGSIRLRVLGSVEVCGPDGATIELNPMPAAVLCRLLVADGSPVDADTLVADVWTERPSSGTGAVRVTVARLRQVLSRVDLADRLVTRPSGWSISFEPEETDLGWARRLIDEAAEARRRGNVRAARVAAVDAVALLSRPPLASVASLTCFDDLLAEAASLADRADNELTEAELALGRGTDALARCLSRAEADVFDEGAVSRVVRALTQAGRHVEAVDWCHRHTSALVDRGLVPSESFRALELSVLRHSDGGVPLRRGSDRSFVGRDDELDELVAVLESLSDGAHVALVEGVAGIGKSRLLREFCSARVPLTMPVLVGACSPEAAVPFEPFIEALGSVSESRWTDLLRRADHELDPMLQTLAITETIGRALLDELGRGGVLVIDDAHWLDPASVSVLRMVLRRATAPVMVVLVVRTPDDRDNSVLATLVAESALVTEVVRVTVGGLDADSVAELVRRELGDASLDVGLADLRALSRGNPLIVRSLVRAAVGSFTDGGDSRQIVRALFAPRFARLGPAHAPVIAAAATLGHRFGLRRLCDVAGVEIGAALDAVEMAVDLELVAATERYDEFVFDHDLIRREALNQVSDARVAVFHARAAEVLLRESGADAQVVHHLVAAGSLTDPAHLADVAADAAINGLMVGMLDMVRAMDGLAFGLAAAGSGAEAKFLAVRAAVLAADGRTDEAMAHLERGLQLSVGLQMDDLTALMFGWQSAAGQLEASDDALHQIREVCARLRASGSFDSLGAALTTLSLWLRLGPHRAEAREVSEELWQLADLTGDPVMIHNACSAEHHLLFVEGAPVDERRRSTRLMRETAEAAMNRFGLMRAYRTEVNDALAAGDLVEARRAHARMTEQSGDESYPLAVFLVQAIDLGIRIAIDDLDGVEEAVGALGVLGREQRVTVADFTVAGQLFVLRWEQDRLAELVDVLSFVSATSSVVTWQHALALAQHAAGDSDTAAATFTAALAITAAEPVRDWLWLPEAIVAAEACALVGTDEQCDRLARVLEPYAGVDVVVAEGSVITLGPVARPLAVLLERAGRHDDAARAAADARERTGDTGARLWARVGVRLDG